MHYNSSPKEPLLCDSFAPEFSDRYIEPAEYALYSKFKTFFNYNIQKCQSVCLYGYRLGSWNCYSLETSIIRTSRT